MKETKAPQCTLNPKQKDSTDDQKLAHKQDITI